MVPFGQAVLLWRLERALTQKELARRAGLPRPNLSAIERGQRDVSLRTLRALAAALDVRPGVLADGIAPREEERWRPSRQAMERIAEAVVQNTSLSDPKEEALAARLRDLVSSRLRAAGASRRAKRPGRAAERAWLSLSGYPEAVIDSLVARILEKLRAR